MMVRGAGYQGSSRKNRDLPFLPAFRWAGAGLQKKLYDGQKFMRHNMGLCRMGWGEGRILKAVRVAWG